MDQNWILHNFELGSVECISPKDLQREVLSVYNSNKLSVYDMQKSALDWNWYDFSWFKEEEKYRKMIYNNPVPVYKLRKD